MNRTTQTRIASALAGVLLAATSMQSAVAQDYSKVTLRHASGLPQTYPMVVTTTNFNEDVEKATDGKVKVQMFWGGSLGGMKEALDLVSKGAVDISDIVPGYFITQLPLYSMTNAIPHTFFDPAAATVALMDVSASNPEQVAEYEENNIKPLIFRALGNFYFLCTSPVKTMEDFKGLKIKSFGNYIPKLVEALGATPVNVIVSDAYEAMKRGSLDCTYSSFPDMEAYKLHEVAKYIVDVPMGGIVAYSDSMNLAKFNALTPDTQALLVEEGKKQTLWWNDQMEADGARAKAAMLEAGAEMVTFDDPEALHAAVPDMVALWLASMEERGLGAEGKSYADALMAKYQSLAKTE
ncbi:C4-dicarboxylate TRAP transporter substrate-binding protein [Chachezhania sediminis]|uniref:C4-dicarboxylate TRAP transporter substrate-binding protein n=1 Tax=Chachezhania sediminis TaxID=2599291 RepID=UPI00131E4152|nr:C4-dicarboxylate TRAP transporter substrate-binding protein [Chachezhania sediminis]